MQVLSDINYVVVLNWNGWRDTLACIDTVLASKGAPLRVVVCDNGSGDGSLEKLVEWAEGRCSCDVPQHPRLARLLSGRQGVPYQLLTRESVMEGSAPAAEAPLIFIDNAANLGFAGGNNVGIRYAMQQADMARVWLLNNDTLVEPDALANMVARLETEAAPAVCGSRLMFADDPAVVQAMGGNGYNAWTGNASRSLGRYLPESENLDAGEYEAQLDYLCGASMLLPRAFLEQVGLMCEDYFLYYEEVDWMTRNAGRFRQVIAADALVYHKEGSSIGSASLDTRPSALSEYYMFTNKLRFTWRYYPARFPVAYLATWAQVLNRARRGYFDSAARIARILLGLGRCPN
ncbi:MAG: glycosyltransferase family 2 protein [Halieaceae bacterium]|jgi:GT2 family glycosyltransferase|nr:glycosyltransferase family 2 protein [Halieaceae bacterium]